MEAGYGINFGQLDCCNAHWDLVHIAICDLQHLQPKNELTDIYASTVGHSSSPLLAINTLNIDITSCVPECVLNLLLRYMYVATGSLTSTIQGYSIKSHSFNQATR